MSSPDHHSIRKIVLPSGRAIEVVRFDEAEEHGGDRLHVCPSCHCDLVQPNCWTEADDERWELSLECPNCWWSATGVYDRDEVELLEEKLDDGLAQMLNDLQRLAHANMAEDIDRFSTALAADLILPEDF